MTSAEKTSRPQGVPPPQRNLHTATARSVEELRGQSPEQMRWLGATGAGRRWRLPVLDGTLDVDVSSGRVCVAGEQEVSPAWRVLALHYLAVRQRPGTRRPEITFADLPGGRAYAKVYRGRVLGRLCATAGRDRATLCAAAEAVGARVADGGDAAFDLSVFPRVPVRLIWHAPDEEFPPSATLLLPANIESFFCIEDIVVLSESVVSRLSGRAF